LGGEWWKDIMWHKDLTPEEKEAQVVERYKNLLKNYLPFTGSCPVREKTGKRVKYYIIFCSRHEDAIVLMNDIMHKAYFKKMHEADFKGTLFEFLSWYPTKPKESIKDIILDEIRQTPGLTRKELWISIVQKYFMHWLKSDYTKAVQELVNEEKLYSPTKRKTRRLNDNCELFPVQKNNPHSLTITKLEKTIKLKIKWQRYKLLTGKEVELVQQVNDGSIIKRFDKTPIPEKPIDIICPHFLELKWAYGCPYDCSWCYLKGTFRFRPESIKPAFKPLEKVKLHTQAFLEQVNTPEILNTGEIADSLMKEDKIYPFSKFIISFFEKQSTHKVLFVTKSVNIKNLLDIPSKRQVIVSFSLNALPVAERWEKKAPPVIKRIEAAERLSNVGYEVRIRIDPIVPIDDWERYYLQLIDEIFSRFSPSRITLGSLRGLQSTLNGTKDHSWVHFLQENSNWGKKVDFTTRYKLYKTLLKYLKNNLNYSEIALCKETMAMWNRLEMDWFNMKCNCVW
jgi:spore photoproduct lyase